MAEDFNANNHHENRGLFRLGGNEQRGGVRRRNGGERGRGFGHRTIRGNNYRGFSRGREVMSRPETPQEIDGLNKRTRRGQSLDRSLQQVMPIRQNYGGRYQENLEESEHNERQPNYRSHKQRRGGYMGFQKLENMLTLEPDQLVVALSNEDTGLEKLFKRDLSDDYIVLILRVLNRLFESTFQENKTSILATVCQKDFIDKLTIYLCSIYVHDNQDKFKNKYFWDNPESFWNDLLKFCDVVIQLIPNTACEILPKLIKQSCIAVQNIEQHQNIVISTAIKENLEELQVKIMMCVEEREKQKISKFMLQDDMEPPDDYRLISLYPTIMEITTREKSFVRANVVVGNYRSVDHYLDVQFRLLREDFVAPLREGICDYLAQQLSKERRRVFNVRLYHEVYFVKKHTLQDKVTLVVQLKHKMKFENSRRLMFGSLVCFTNNNFRTIIFGTVASRDESLTKKNQVAIDLLDEVNDEAYTMVECSVYFEPYYHVLKALQMMTEERFPMKRYIVDVITDVNPPSYLNFSSEYNFIDFTFNPLVPNSWPSAYQLGFDPSQYKAFQAALTKEFCVIQGPPGTGKTFIGLKVAKVLLDNFGIWNTSHCPLLVICFTNHALDQFLEGIADFTNKLVRIGGQSKSVKLKCHNIKEMRCRFSRMHSSNQLLFKKRDEIKSCMSSIYNYQNFLDAISAADRIINFKNFEHFDKQLVNSWFSIAKHFEVIDWLMGGRTATERYEERRKFKANEIQAQIQQNTNENIENDSDEEFFDAETEDARVVDDREDFIPKLESLLFPSKYLLTQKNLETDIYNLERELAGIEVKVEENNTYVVYDEKQMKEDDLRIAREKLDYFKWRMDQFNSNNYPQKPQHVDYKNPMNLNSNERWGLYFYWLRLFQQYLKEDIAKLDCTYRKLYRQYEEVKQIEDIRVMREMLVIGMTTTGAAKYQTLLQALKCPIVIIEEAAEVLESHVVVSLTNECKHLILIGDHQQLRPTTADYHLAKNCNLDVSLFERMIKNGFHSEQLEVQHRMRPEIVKLIVPTIYPKLENHDSVKSYPPVSGINKNLFFITHSQPEEEAGDTGSKRNHHEARFLIKLARHLILQGYEPNEITILSTYSGQMFCLWKERKQFPLLKDVRITVVDNFQGEENKIILLSLVRSNEKENVGFLKIDNRICVALSRAKEGLYIIGNMEILQKSNKAWTQINNYLEESEQIGSHLTLQCQIHLEQLTRVQTADDFKIVTEGGCSQLCGKQLNCSHICSSMCHVTDRDHTKYKCKERCIKILCELDHQCPDKCFQECKPCQVPLQVTLKCGHTHLLPCHVNDTSTYNCPTKIKVELECGHEVEKPCHRDLKTFPCPKICDVRKLCGHSCDRRCHVNDDPDHLKTRCLKPCGRIKKGCSINQHECILQCYQECPVCEIKIKKKRSCGHMHEIPCSIDVEIIECGRRCNKKLECGHDCRQKCNETCGNCAVKVTKTIEGCGHKVNLKCCEVPDRSRCNGKCPLLLPCGHPCNKKCKEPCQERCSHLVENPHIPACGHKFQIPCFKSRMVLENNSQNLLKHCTELCDATLMCSHICTGTCGSCFQGRIHVPCQDKCSNIQICGHACEIPCKDACRPCNKKCSYRCAHNRCGKKCGEPCVVCKEPCTRRCSHVQCKNYCGQPCSVPPCSEPCPKLLQCRHPCLGFCGDICPPVCRQCNPEDNTFEILFGNEDEEDARFVYLTECKHVIESEGMDYWLQTKTEDEINVKHCPKCKTTLTSTQRYSDYIKDAFKHVNNIKKKWFDEEKNTNKIRTQLLERIFGIGNNNDLLYINSKYLKNILHDLYAELQENYKGKRNPVNKTAVDLCTAEIQLIEKVVNIFMKAKLKEQEETFEKCLKKFNFIIMMIRNKDCRISNQRIADLNLEIDRFEKFIQLYLIENNPQFKSASDSKIKELHMEVVKQLNSIKKFTDKSTVKESMEKLRDAVDKSMTLTEEERGMIVQVMRASGLGRGHWYKCPNGHYYVIGECGGAMQIGKCNECGAKIGGTAHRLLETNAFGGEIDGARYPAYSDAANMMNYQF